MPKKDFFSYSKNTLKLIAVSMVGWMGFDAVRRIFNINALNPFLELALALVIGFILLRNGIK